MREKIIPLLKEKFKLNDNFFFIFSLVILCFFFFFCGLGDYRLIDIDETRYIHIAQNMYNGGNYITPYLNFETFLEKPPLFYWLVALSYKFFGDINNFTSRFSIALLAVIGVFAVYVFVLNIVKSKVCAFLSSFILMSSFWYALFSHIAIMDSGFTVFVTCAFTSGVSTLFCASKRCKIFLWCLGYFFLALAVLQKGLIGIILPGGTLLIVFLIMGRAKEIIKPVNLIPGIIFLLVAAPWHFLIFRENGMLWFNDYIVKHHFARFFGSSMGIGRQQPLLFYIPIILGGFLPWTMFLISAFIKGAKYLILTVKSEKSIIPFFKAETKEKQLVLISSIWFFTLFLFFSFSSTKLPTYILTAFPPLSVIAGYFLYEYLTENKNKKYVEVSALITFLIFLSASIYGLYYYFSGKINIGLSLVVLFLIFSISGLIFLKFNKKIWITGCIMAFSFSLFALNSSEVFNFVTSFGQNELEEFASIANNAEEKTELVSFGFSKKYSLLHFYKKNKIHYITKFEKDKNQKLENIYKNAKDTNEKVYVILKNKSKYDKTLTDNLNLIKKEKKYSLYIAK